MADNVTVPDFPPVKLNGNSALLCVNLFRSGSAPTAREGGRGQMFQRRKQQAIFPYKPFLNRNNLQLRNIAVNNISRDQRKPPRASFL